MRVVIVTGLSGSGKSTAIHVLEDLGFYCIDNLPVTLLPRFLELCESSDKPISRVALGIDLRERVSLRQYPEVLAELRSRGQRVEILYLEAADEVLGPVKDSPESNNVLIAASRTENVDLRVSALELGGLTAKIVDVEAFAIPDDIVEAIRWRGPSYVLGVQWHPEFMFGPTMTADHLDGTPILSEFLDAVRTKKSNNKA